MRKAFLLAVVDAFLLACGGDDNPGGPGPSERHLAFTVQPSTTAAGQVITPAVEVSIEDAAGNLVTGQNPANAPGIRLSLIGPNPQMLTGYTASGVINGVAVFSSLGTTKSFDTYFLKATYVKSRDTDLDVKEATSQAFAVLPGPATAIASHSGDAQVAPQRSAVFLPPSVLATDHFGNPVPGVSVAFEVVSGGGTVEGAQATTDADGVAAVKVWTLGSSPGPNTLRATSGTLTGSPLTFTATAVALPTAITIEVHDNFFRSVRNGSGGGSFGRVPADYARDTVAVGGTVTWVWVGQNHNVKQELPSPPISLSGNHDAPFSLGPMTFSSPGTVFYRCTNHSTWFEEFGATGMAGKILVR